MKTYQCHKRVQAARITKIEVLSAEHNPLGRILEFTLEDMSQFYESGERFERAEVGQYFIVYEDGYKSVSPAAAFESGYAEVVEGRMSFGAALEALKAGQRVARAGWNGADQWIALGKGNDHLAAAQFWNEHARTFAEHNGGGAPVRPYFILKTAQDDILMGWSPSQSDALADDWIIINPPEPVIALRKGQAIGKSTELMSSYSAIERLRQIAPECVKDSDTMNRERLMAQMLDEAKQPAGPRVTEDDIKAAIKSEHYFTAADGVAGAFPNSQGDSSLPWQRLGMHTICMLVLNNGFTVTGESACVSAENFDADLGRKYAFENAFEKLWPLMGFALADRLHRELIDRLNRESDSAFNAGFKAVTNKQPRYFTLMPHQQRVVDEKAELDDKLAKLLAFLGTPMFASLPEDEQHRLTEQSNIMRAYSAILGYRIAAF